MLFENTLAFAQTLDGQDELAAFKQAFYFPQHNGVDAIYFCGNSLGLQPKNTEAAFKTELDTWKNIAIEGYFEGTTPWLYYHEYVAPSLGKLVGGGKHEITVMNALTVN